MADEGDPGTNETPQGDSEDEAERHETDRGELEVVGEDTQHQRAEETQETDRGDSEEENTEMPDQETSRVYTQAELEGETPPRIETTEEESKLTPTQSVEMEMASTNSEEVVGETEEHLPEHTTAQESGEEIITDDLDQEAQQPPANIEETKKEDNQRAVEREVPEVGDYIIFINWQPNEDPGRTDLSWEE